MPIWIKRIEFNEAQDVNYSFHGEDAYSLPKGRASVSIVFQIRDRRDRSFQLTEVMLGPIASYDEMVRQAYTRLKKRLEGIGKVGEQIKLEDSADKPPG